jgi:light-regulated signal transduction histidine kinase (bacteriophytochrome)
MGDDVQLELLFQNLINNGIKFHGEEPPHIHISARQKKSEWFFSIKDNGIGIEPRNKDNIFNIFQRMHSRSEYPGTGIGLAICKKILDLHGGKIWVKSKKGTGSVFYFTLPDRRE